MPTILHGLSPMLSLAHYIPTDSADHNIFPSRSVFEWTNLAPRLSNRKNVLETLTETEPDLSHKRAMATVTGYLSGVSPSMLAFIVFGTTKTFQRKMYRTFVPRALRRRISGASSRSSSKGDGDGHGDDRMAAWHRGSHMPPPSTANSSRARASLTANSSRGSTTTFGSTPKRPHSVSVTSASSTTMNATTTATTVPSARKLGPIYEPECLWLDEDDDEDENGGPGVETGSKVRHSQIGLAVTVPAPSLPPPPSARTTMTTTHTINDCGPRGIFPHHHHDDDDDDDTQWHGRHHDSDAGSDGLASIPLSRFNSRTHSRGYSYGSGYGSSYGHRPYGSDVGAGVGSSPVVWGGARRGSEGGNWEDRASRYGGARYNGHGVGGGVSSGSGNYSFPSRRGSAV